MEVEEFRTKKIKELEEYKKLLQNHLILLEKMILIKKEIEEIDEIIEILESE